MPDDKKLQALISEFEEGIALSKCKKCGCMKGALEEIQKILTNYPGENTALLREKVKIWLGQTGDSLYT